MHFRRSNFTCNKVLFQIYIRSTSLTMKNIYQIIQFNVREKMPGQDPRFLFGYECINKSYDYISITKLKSSNI